MSPAGAWRPAWSGPLGLFIGAWTALGLCTLPVVLLQHLDAFLVFLPAADLLRDLGVMLLLAAIPAAVLSALALPLLWLSRSAAAGWERAALLVYAPVAWLFAWQFARMSWLWVKQVSGHGALPTTGVRYAVMLVMVAALIWLLRPQRRNRLLLALHERLLSLRWVLLLAVFMAGGGLLLHPFPPNPKPSAPANAVSRADRPDVIIISVDALAGAEADLCDPRSRLMPRTAAYVAGHMHCHSRFYAASNYTTPTTSTLETGLLPWTHQANQISSKVAEPLRGNTLAGALAAAGYRNYQTTDNHLASPRHRATHVGYADSAITPSALWRDRLRASLTWWPESSIPSLMDSALSFLGAFDKQLHATDNPFDSDRVLAKVERFLARGPAEQPAMVWVHAMPPHGPYLPPESTKYKLLPAGQLDRWSQFLDENTPYPPAQQGLIDLHRLRYRESIMATDMALAALLERLRSKGRLEKAILIITADHGESFERGWFGHAGPPLHEALIRIPFAIQLPGQTGGKVWNAPVSQADIAPSLLDLLQLPPLPLSDGQSLGGLWRGESLESRRPVFAMALERQSRFSAYRDGYYAVIDGRYKLHHALRSGEQTLYDLVSDPLELQDISRQQPERSAAMQALLLERVNAAEAARRRAWRQP